MHYFEKECFHKVWSSFATDCDMDLFTQLKVKTEMFWWYYEKKKVTTWMNPSGIWNKDKYKSTESLSL